MFFHPKPAEAQQVENSGRLPLLQSDLDAIEPGGDFRIGFAQSLPKTTGRGELEEELLLVSKVLQHHLYKAVCGFQNAGHYSSAHDYIFKPDVTTANLDVLLGQTAHVQCVRLKHSHRSFHRPSLRVAVQFSFLSPHAGAKDGGNYIKMQRMSEIIGSL
jgi:hypothetical protein